MEEEEARPRVKTSEDGADWRRKDEHFVGERAGTRAPATAARAARAETEWRMKSVRADKRRLLFMMMHAGDRRRQPGRDPATSAQTKKAFKFEIGRLFGPTGGGSRSGVSARW